MLSYYVAIVLCQFLTAPTNGIINCSVGGDGVPNPGDTCTFACNTGYELMGSGMRTCGNDRSWSGSDALCSRGEQLPTHIASYV